jgi:hypothetical protein
MWHVVLRFYPYVTSEPSRERYARAYLKYSRRSHSCFSSCKAFHAACLSFPTRWLIYFSRARSPARRSALVPIVCPTFSLQFYLFYCSRRKLMILLRLDSPAHRTATRAHRSASRPLNFGTWHVATLYELQASYWVSRKTS